jgi:uncharacterized protein
LGYGLKKNRKVNLLEDTSLTISDRETLLKIAREAITAAANGERPLCLNADDYSEALKQEGVSFVTLTIGEQLRGCIGALEAYQPLYLDVQEHAVAAASQDYRFPPVSAQEVPHLNIEISRLTPPKSLEYERPQELPEKLRPGIDGVLITDGVRRATFLPQVWEKLPDPQEFLAHLCQKMGVSPDHWRRNKLQVFTYQVEEFREE